MGLRLPMGEEPGLESTRPAARFLVGGHIYIYIITSLAADRPPRAPGVKSCLEGCLLERGSTEGLRASATTYKKLRIAT